MSALHPTGEVACGRMFAGSARKLVAGFAPGGRRVVVHRGQLSLTELLRELLDLTGPADLLLESWPSGEDDAQVVAGWGRSGLVRTATWVIGPPFARKEPEFVRRMVGEYGPGAIRIRKTHAKYALLRAGDWRVTVRGSMNFNAGRRLELVEIEDNPAVYDSLLAQAEALAGDGADVPAVQQGLFSSLPPLARTPLPPPATRGLP